MVQAAVARRRRAAAERIGQAPFHSERQETHSIVEPVEKLRS
jgi:hypothetical protein